MWAFEMLVLDQAPIGAQLEGTGREDEVAQGQRLELWLGKGLEGNREGGLL